MFWIIVPLLLPFINSLPQFGSAVSGAVIATTTQIPLDIVNRHIAPPGKSNYPWKAINGAISGLQTKYIDTDVDRSVLVDMGVSAAGELYYDLLTILKMLFMAVNNI
jgi:hypothetical protein